MPEYSFETLSPIDFENLVRDLLQAELSIRLESFKAGRDKGIDLRYTTTKNRSLIVQAKHYAGTGFSGLLSNLKQKEKSKIKKLNPDRYLLVTSVGLSPANKDEICQALFPYILSPKDIYGKNDLNNLLGIFPEIERQHFKLWLSSADVLEEILHSRVINQTKISLEEIRDKAQLYVSNQSFNCALEILKEHNYVIIAGIPGIGKTTLAKMLVLHFLRANHDFVDVSYDISEAYSLPARNRPKVYLYDDFLGRTSIVEKLRKNEDHRLFDFIASVRRSNTAKLILTTREYILRQAQKTYEILNNPVFEKPQCIVDLSQYTRPIRAKILYNHLYFSRLPKAHIDEIVRKATYLKIIDHPNYSPRIVEYMTDPMWVSPRESNNYPEIFLGNLSHPFLIWEQAFNNHLSEKARYTLLILGNMPHEIFVEDLEIAVKQFLLETRNEISTAEFHRILSELQGNFIVLNQDTGNDIVAFHNPSVQDFVENYLSRNHHLYEALIKSACFFEQLHWICEKISRSAVKQLKNDILVAIQRTLSSTPCTLINYSSGSGRPTYKGRDHLEYGTRLAFIATLLKNNNFLFLSNFFHSAIAKLIKELENINLRNNDLIRLAKEAHALDCIRDIEGDLFSASKESLFRNAFWVSDVSCITDLFDLYSKKITEENRMRITKTIDTAIDNLNDVDNPQMIDEDLSSLEEMDTKYGLGLQEQLDRISCLLESAQENFQPEEDYDDDRYRGKSNNGWVGNAELSDMFRTLIR